MTEPITAGWNGNEYTDQLIALCENLNRSDLEDTRPVITDHYDAVNLVRYLQLNYVVVPRPDPSPPAPALTLAAHVLFPSGDCSCHRWSYAAPRTYACGEDDRIQLAHAEHQVEILRETGVELVPSPDRGQARELEKLRELARDTARMFGEIEGSGELYYAPLHRQIELLAEVAAKGGGQ